MSSETSGACMHALTASNAKLLKQPMSGEGCQELDQLAGYDTVILCVKQCKQAVCAEQRSPLVVHKAPHELIKLLLSCTREHAEGIDTCNSYTDKSGIHSDDYGTRV